MATAKTLRGGKPIPLPKGEGGHLAASLVAGFWHCGAGKVTPAPDYQENCVLTATIGQHGGTYVDLYADPSSAW